MSILFASRFFRRVTPVRAYLRALLLVITVYGVWNGLRGAASDDALIYILLIQAFAVSTGFVQHASRGYYDPLLSRVSRRDAALGHLWSANVPGLLAWIVVGFAQMIGAKTITVMAFSPSSIAALCLISAVAWAFSVRFGALSGGSAWLLLWVFLFVSLRGFRLLALIRGPDASPYARVASGAAIPLLIPGAPWTTAEISMLYILAALAVGAAVVYLIRVEFPLREDES